MHLPEHGKFNRKDISVMMERMLDLDMYQYSLECRNCHRACDFRFMSHEKLSFASVGKLAGVFSLPCRRLAEVLEKSLVEQNGQLSLLSGASNDGWADPAISSCGVFTTRDGD